MPCTLARGITETVRCWKQPENVICLRHGRWISPWTGEGQPDLSACPDILRAHRQHLRLVRRLGRDAVAIGYAYAEHICHHWHEQRQHDDAFRRRMHMFHGPDWAVARADPTVAAAAYPQQVALTRLMASPYWQAQARSDNLRGQELFVREIRRTVAPGYLWPLPHRSADPLHQWIVHRRPYDPPAALVNYRRWPDRPWAAR